MPVEPRQPPPIGRALPARLRHAAAMVLILLCGTLVYLPSLHGAFIYDDRVNIVGNQRLRDIADLGAVVTSGHQETRPLTLISFAFSFWLGGEDPFGFRLVNLLLHLVTGLLVYAVALRLRQDLLAGGGQQGGAPSGQPASVPPLELMPACAGLLFVVHPVATEGVAYINARAGLLSSCFGLASLLLYLRFEARGAFRPPPTRRWLAFAGSSAALVLAVLSKESAVVLPLLLALYLACFRRPPGGQLLRSLGPLALQLVLAGLLAAALLAWARYPHGRTFGLDLMPWSAYLPTQVRVLGQALLLLLYPAELCIDHDLRLSQGPWDAGFVGALAGWTALLMMAWRLRVRAPLLLFTVVWFLVGMAPTNSLVQFKDLLAERHLYLPLCGFCLLVGWALCRARELAARRRVVLGAVVLAGFASLLTVLSLRTAARAAVLADPVALWRDTVRLSPGKSRPHLNLGIALLEGGQERAGLKHLQRAVALDPYRADGHYNLGVYHERHDGLDQALGRLRRAVGLTPARRYRQTLAKVANRRGVELFKDGHLPGAAKLFEEARRVWPEDARYHFNLGMVRMRQGNPTAAVELFGQALRLDPGHRKARYWLARLGGGARSELGAGRQGEGGRRHGAASR